MEDQRTGHVESITNGHNAFLPPASLRQPSAALGPRSRRTVVRIIEATRDVFLTRGYAGTTIDEIARVADVSRASFYTYFASKREVLLAVGAHSASECVAVIERLPAAGSSRSGLAQWVGEYFEFLDVHGSFAFAWTQAAHEDEEIRTAGMKRHIGICRQLGVLLAATAGKTVDHPELLGLAATSAMERSWNYCQLYTDTVDRNHMITQVATVLWAAARQPSPRLTP